MGARVYLPGIAKFAQVDPIEGGVDNNYVYPPDAVNDFDLSGLLAQKGRQGRSEKQLSANERRALNEGKNKWNAKDFEAAKKKLEYNQKMNRERNVQKRNNSIKGGGTPLLYFLIPSFLQQGIKGKRGPLS